MLAAFDTIEKLAPTTVVSGHKRDGDPDSVDDIARTRRYIQDFGHAADQAADYQEVYYAMVALYPERLNRGVL